MNIETAQKLQRQTLLSQWVAVKQYQQVASEKQEAKNEAVSLGDRVEISATPQYTANLLFEKISAKVAEKYGIEAAEQIQFDPDLDTSPQATAERIFTFATSFYQKFIEQNAGEDAEEVLNHFMTIILQIKNNDLL